MHAILEIDVLNLNEYFAFVSVTRLN